VLAVTAAGAATDVTGATGLAAGARNSSEYSIMKAMQMKIASAVRLSSMFFFLNFNRWYWIYSAATPGITSKDSIHRQDATAQHPMFFYRFKGIIGTVRLKPTALPK
jgi:hypothetical protein